MCPGGGGLEVKPSPRLKLEAISDLEFGRLYWEYFGARRGCEMLGWALVAAATGAQDPVVLRGRLQERGLSRAGMYKMLTELREFGRWVEGEEAVALPVVGIQLAERISAKQSTIVDCMV
jgi:hypothetical protein